MEKEEPPSATKCNKQKRKIALSKQKIDNNILYISSNIKQEQRTFSSFALLDSAITFLMQVELYFDKLLDYSLFLKNLILKQRKIKEYE